MSSTTRYGASSGTRVLLQLEADTAESITIPGGFEDDITSFSRGQMVVKAPSIKPVEVKSLDYCVVDHWPCKPDPSPPVTAPAARRPPGDPHYTGRLIFWFSGQYIHP